MRLNKKILRSGAAFFSMLALLPFAAFPKKAGKVKGGEKPVVAASATFIDAGDFIRGFDASGVDYSERENGVVYSDVDGSKIDFFAILKNHGVNTVRLRVWVDPSKAQDGTVVSDKWGGRNYAQAEYTYDTTLERVKRMAKRAKAAGLKFMLDIHYSDYWTDPGKQIIPYSWQNIKNSNEMAAKIAEYTNSVLKELEAEGALPDYVQIGNEIDPGFLTQLYLDQQDSSNTKYASSSVSGKIEASPNSNFAKYLAAGAKAVKEAGPDIKVIIHVTNTSDWTSSAVIKAMANNARYYDIIGLSFYPWEANHRTVSALKSNINSIRAAGKAALVVETSMLCENGDSEKLGYVTKHMIDPATKKVYADLEMSGGKVAGSTENQQKVIAHIMQEVADAGGIGVCAWGGQRVGDTTWGMFGSDGKPLSSIDVFKTAITVSEKPAKQNGINATYIYIKGGWNDWKDASQMKETSPDSKIYTFTTPKCGKTEFGFVLDDTWYSDSKNSSGAVAIDGKNNANCKTCSKNGAHTITLDLNTGTWKCE